MAEIKIEKKKPIWPWILLIIIILAVIAYFIYANNESDDYPDDFNSEEIDTLDNNDMDTSINYQDTLNFSDNTSYIIYSESIKDSTRIGTDSTYTKTALYNLSKAVTAIASEYDLENSQALEDLKRYNTEMDGIADSRASNATGMTKNLRTMSTKIVSVLESIQMKQFPALNSEVADLKQTANQLNTTALEKQQKTLQAFFRQANNLINKMNS